VTDLERLRQLIRDQHGVEATHLRSDHVQETIHGARVRDGIVEVFAIKGHGRTNIAYGWIHDTADGGARYVSILRLSPILTANAAVRASLAADVGRTRHEH
jgi:hypothetical protein